MEVMMDKYGGDAGIDEIKQFVLDKMSTRDYFSTDVTKSEIVSINKITYQETDRTAVYQVTVRDNTPGMLRNTYFVQLNVYNKSEPVIYMCTDDELLDIISGELGINKSEFKEIRIVEDKNDSTYVYFTFNDTDYWCVMERSEYYPNKIMAYTKKPHGENEFPIISEEEAMEKALHVVCKESVDDLESYEVRYDDEKKQYDISIVVYGAKYGKTVFWEFYIDAYTGLLIDSKFEGNKDYGQPKNVKLISEEEAIEIALSYLEGYERSGMKVTVEAEEVDNGFPITRYYITATSSVTVFKIEINSDTTQPSRIDRSIDYEAVRLSKTGKYISEEIAKEIALYGMKDVYSIDSCELDESGETAVYDVVVRYANKEWRKKISAESGMVIEEKF